jgi:hypothetical protein
VVILDGYLFDPAPHQEFVKFGEGGCLLCDVILQVIEEPVGQLNGFFPFINGCFRMGIYQFYGM